MTQQMKHPRIILSTRMTIECFQNPGFTVVLIAVINIVLCGRVHGFRVINIVESP